jgi:NAD(P)-dependent dehydrogenase (short-subunit alcohol dehydrogenase family)
MTAHRSAPLMKGRICLITGGTGGIGRQTAEGLAHLGASLIIVGRDQERGERAVSEIQRVSGNDGVTFFPADLSSLAEVRRLAQEVTTGYPRLHVLVNDVGNWQTQRRETTDGLELTFALNVLTPFLLTTLLLPTLQDSAPSRIVNVNSTAHRFTSSLNLKDLQSMQFYRPMDVYSRAKLANLLITYELARRLVGTGCTVNAVDPGFTIQAPQQGNSRSALAWALNPFQMVGSRIMTYKRAAQSSIYAASSPKLDSVSGKYIGVGKRLATSSTASYDEATARELWSMCEELAGLSRPG